MTKTQTHQVIVNENNLLKRFLDKIKIINNCWEWTASKNENGYGYFRVNGILRRTHRITYEYYYGELNHSLENLLWYFILIKLNHYTVKKDSRKFLRPMSYYLMLKTANHMMKNHHLIRNMLKNLNKKNHQAKSGLGNSKQWVANFSECFKNILKA